MGILAERICARPALLLRWHEHHNPLPLRLISSPHHRTPGPMREAAPWLRTGAAGEPFDFCGHMRRLIADIVRRCETLAHIDVDRILLGVTLARNHRAHGLQARVTPLRFARGQLRRERRGATFQVQRYFVGDREFFYVMTFCLPRFLDQDFSDKFITVFHELFHIGPECNGELRRHNGRYSLHSHSQRGYDQQMAGLARAYLAGSPDADLHAFLRLDFAQLQHRHGAIAGVVVPRPKVVPVERRR